MLKHTRTVEILICCFYALLLIGCSATTPTEPSTPTSIKLIDTLRHERIDQLYYETMPDNVKEIIVQKDIIPDLIDAYDRGGDNLFRFNVVVILNHRSDLSGTEKTAITQCLERALKDSFAWVRTEAVWGLGLLGAASTIPTVIPLLDDPDPGVVNETVLTLYKLAGIPGPLPISNQDMPAEQRKEMVEFWKAWWNTTRPQSSP